MRVTVSFSRKTCPEQFESIGASCEVAIEIEPGGTVPEQIRAAQALAWQAVEEELSRRTGAAPPPVARHTEPGPPARPPQRSGRPYRGSNGRTAGTRNEIPDPPKNGRELYAWATREEEEGSEGLVKRIIALGQAEGFPAKIVQWTKAQAMTAYEAVMQPA